MADKPTAGKGNPRKANPQEEKVIYFLTLQTFPMVTTTQSRLLAYNTPHLKQTISEIAAIANPDKVFLMAASLRTTQSESAFTTDPIKLKSEPHYFLLILKKPGDASPNDLIQDSIENRHGYKEAVTTLVYNVCQFSDWILASHAFATHTIQRGILCYDAGAVELPPLPAFDPMVQNAMLQKDYQFHDKIAGDFLIGADLYRIRRQYSLAMFHIHQAAEQLYMALLRVIMGLKTSIHNLDKLYRYSCYFSPKLFELFPRDTDREKQLFSALQKAYTDSRYAPGFLATEMDTNYLYNRVEKLKTIVSDIASRQFAIAI
jgi:uncharacterized protein